MITSNFFVSDFLFESNVSQLYEIEITNDFLKKAMEEKEFFHMKSREKSELNNGQKKSVLRIGKLFSQTIDSERRKIID